MKTSVTRIVSVAASIAAVFAFTSLTGFADGAKGGATRLIQSPMTATVEKAAPAMKGCGNCKDVVGMKKDTSARGAYKPDVLVGSHGCKSCVTTISTDGFGKGARRVVDHGCVSCLTTK
jgi:hypothetical protein